MKKINIYIGSSEEDLREESIELKNFVHRMADDLPESYKDEFDIRPLPREGEDFTDDDIRNSEMCFFLFNHSADDENERNFDFAYRVFKTSKNGRPKVYVYFRKLEGKESEDNSIDRLKEKIDKEYGHFYENFSELDTVKLRLLLNLKFQEMDFLPVEMDGNVLLFCGQRVVDMDKVGEFCNNRELNALKAELAKVNEKYLDMKPEYAKGGCSDEFYREYAEVASRRSNLMEQLEEQRKQIFELSLGLSRDSAKGEMTPRMKKAYKLLEEGDSEGCLAVLDPKDIDSDVEVFEKEGGRKASIFIREYKLRIDVLKTTDGYKGRFDEIKKTYEKAVRLALKYEVELDVVVAYANYLYLHSDSNSAEKFFLKAIEIHERLAKADPKQYESDLATSYNSLACLYSDTQRTAESEEYYSKAIEIWERLVESDPKRYEGGLARIYNNLAVLYSHSQHSTESEKYHLKALEIRERLAESDPKRYEADLAKSCNNLANLYSYTQRTAESEKYHLKAIEILERLVESDSRQYEYYLAVGYNNLANLYSDTQRTTESEEYYRKAIGIQERLAETDPKRYELYLAAGYDNLALLYSNTQRTTESEEYYLKALEIRERLAESDPKRYEADLAKSCNNLANLYSYTQRTAESEKYHLKAIEILERLVESDSRQYEYYLAVGYNNLANLYSYTRRAAEAEKYYQKALEIWGRLVETDPKQYEANLAKVYNNLVLLHRNIQRFKKPKNIMVRLMELFRNFRDRFCDT